MSSILPSDAEAVQAAPDHPPAAVARLSAPLRPALLRLWSWLHRHGRALALGATGLMIVVAWASTFRDMWQRFYPTWGDPRYTYSEWLSAGDSYYTHGPLVPLVSLVLAWVIHRRVGLPASRSWLASVLGWALLAASLGLHLLSVWADVMFVSGFALIGVLLGLLLAWGGFALARAYWLPVVFLLFMVPLPEVGIAHINFALKSYASDAAVWLTTHVFRVPVFKNGSWVYLSPAADGSPKSLVVENVCGGLRSLIALTCFASLFALLCRLKGAWRLTLLALALPIAVACNVVRITGLILVAHYVSVGAAGETSWFHGFSGMAVFVVALALLFGFEYAVLAVGRRLGRDWSDERLMRYLDGLKQVPDTIRAWRPGLLATMLAVMVLSVIWSRPVAAHQMDHAWAKDLPMEIEIDGVRMVGADIELDKQTLAILENPDYICRRYTDAGNHKIMDFLVVFSRNNRKGTHPPDVCIEGGGEEIYHKKLHALSVPAVGDMTLKEIRSQHGPRQTYYLYTYKCGEHYTPSFFRQQAQIFFNGVLSRNTAGALIRFNTPIFDGEAEDARQFTFQAARLLLPAVDQSLP